MTDPSTIDNIEYRARRLYRAFQAMLAAEGYKCTVNRDRRHPRLAKTYLRSARPVRCIETGVVYPSAYDAAAAVGSCRSGITESISHGHRCRGFTFAYVGQARQRRFAPGHAQAAADRAATNPATDPATTADA